MSNRKNHRRNDKFTGPTKKWHRFKNFPRGMDIVGRDDPSSVRQMKHARIKRMRVTVGYEF
jgi:hypothetical protein